MGCVQLNYLIIDLQSHWIIDQWFQVQNDNEDTDKGLVSNCVLLCYDPKLMDDQPLTVSLTINPDRFMNQRFRKDIGHLFFNLTNNKTELNF